MSDKRQKRTRSRESWKRSPGAQHRESVMRRKRKEMEEKEKELMRRKLKDSMMESERSREKRHAVERTGYTPSGKKRRYEDHVRSDSESEFLETRENQDTSESDILETRENQGTSESDILETDENEDIHENVLENGVNDDTDDVDIASSWLEMTKFLMNKFPKIEEAAGYFKALGAEGKGFESDPRVVLQLFHMNSCSIDEFVKKAQRRIGQEVEYCACASCQMRIPQLDGKKHEIGSVQLGHLAHSTEKEEKIRSVSAVGKRAHTFYQHGGR